MSDTTLREKIRRLNRWREEMIRRAPTVSRLEKVRWLVKNNPDFMKAEDALNKLVGYRLKLLGKVDDEIAELERQWDQYDTPSGRRQQMDIEKTLEKLRKDKAGAADIDRNQLVKEVDPVKNYPTRVFHGTISDFVDAIKKHKKLKSPKQGARKVSGGYTTESDIIWVTAEDWIAKAYASGMESKHEYNTKKGIVADYGGVFSLSLPPGLKLVDRYGPLSDEQLQKLNSTLIPDYKPLKKGDSISNAEWRIGSNTTLGNILEVLGVDGILMSRKGHDFSQIGLRDNIDLPVDVFYGRDRIQSLNEEKENILTENKLEISFSPKVPPEDKREAIKLLIRFFKERGTLRWLYSHKWELTRTSHGYIDGDRYDFDYTAKGGKEVQRKPYADAPYTRTKQMFRTPKDAIEHIAAKGIGDKYEDKMRFRGMNMAEWVQAQKQGYIKSKATYNIGDVELTYYAKYWASAHSYAAGFAPYDKEPTRDLPGVVVAVPAELTKFAKDVTGQDTETEYVAGKIPIDKVTGVWYIVPVLVGEGRFELVKRRDGTLDRGSAAPTMSTYVVVPKFGIAFDSNIDENIVMNEGKDVPWFGCVNWTGRVEAHSGNEYFGHLPRESFGNRWSYYPNKQIVFWAKYPPHDEEETSVVDFLEKKGYSVKKNAQSADYYKFMVTEGKLEKAAEDFIAKTIRGTEWEGKVFIAGGYVRDEFMGKDPKDLDLLINAPNGGFEFSKWITKKLGIYKGPEIDPPIPPQPDVKFDEKGNPATPEDKAIWEEWLSKIAAIQKLYKNPVIYPRFGTVKFNLRGIVHNGENIGEMDIEAVMPRKEKYIPGSRKPIVTGGELKDDVERRDFTVNSLLKDLSSGEIMDLTGAGKNDIKAGVVKTALHPDQIFQDDPLRMLRAVRFAMKYDWKLPMFMIKAMTKNAPYLKNISEERIRDELNKMLVTGSPDRAVKLLKVTGLLKYVIPELMPAVRMTQNKHHNQDVFSHILSVTAKTKPELKNRLMALFHDIGKTVTRSVTPTGVHFYGHEDEGAEMVKKIMTRLKYPSELIDAVELGVKNHMRLKGAGEEGVDISDKALRKFARAMGKELAAVLDLMHADNISHADASAMPKQIEGVRRRLDALSKEVDLKKPKLPVNGNDIKELGVPEGPMIGKAMSAVTEAWYENPKITREEALEIARKAVNG